MVGRYEVDAGGGTLATGLSEELLTWCADNYRDLPLLNPETPYKDVRCVSMDGTGKATHAVRQRDAITPREARSMPAFSTFQAHLHKLQSLGMAIPKHDLTSCDDNTPGYTVVSEYIVGIKPETGDYPRLLHEAQYETKGRLAQYFRWAVSEGVMLGSVSDAEQFVLGWSLDEDTGTRPPRLWLVDLEVLFRSLGHIKRIVKQLDEGWPHRPAVSGVGWLG